MTAQSTTLPYSAGIEEAVRLTGVTRTQLYNLLAEGKVQAKKSGRRTLVLMDGLRAYVDGLPSARFGGGGSNG